MNGILKSFFLMTVVFVFFSCNDNGKLRVLDEIKTGGFCIG